MTTIIDDYITTLTPKARGRIKGVAKLVIADQGTVMLTGEGAAPGDGAADVVLLASDEVFRNILSGAQNPIMAYMSGKLKVEGNVQRALRVSSILTDALSARHISDAQEGLREAGHERTKPQRRIGCSQADAIGTDIGHRSVVQIFVCNLDIAGAEMIDFVDERALQDQRQFGAAMAMIGHRGPGGDIKQTRRGIARCGQDRLFDPHADGPPAHAVQITADVVAQRSWQATRCPARCRFLDRSAAPDERHRRRKAVGPDFGCLAPVKQRASDGIERHEPRAAVVAHRDMCRHRQAERLGQCARRIGHQQGVGQVMFDRGLCHGIHFTSLRGATGPAPV